MPKQKSHSGAKKRFTLTGHSDQEGVQEKARLAQDCLRIRNAGKDHQDDDRITKEAQNENQKRRKRS